MSDQLTQFLSDYGPKMEDALLGWLPLSEKPGTDLFNKAVYYAVFPSGKRMRPLFTLLAAKSVGGEPEKALTIACAIEYFHTCSLIFDDLPAMDNARKRRGRQPTHQVFGEDAAMLAALAFLNQGYGLAGQMEFPENQKNRIHRLMHEIATCIGSNGMIGGQMVDLRLKKNVNEQLRSFSYTKTTALTRLMLTTGAIVGGANEEQIEILAVFGLNLGEAYQMLDDIVDEFEDHSKTGLYHKGIDIHALWHAANEKLKKSQVKVIKDLGNDNAGLLIELTEKIFRKLKKQAADRLIEEKWAYPSFSHDGTDLRPE